MRPNDRKYTKTHEWVKLSGEDAVIGITDFAVQELCSGNEGDLVYCDLPEPGRAVVAGETFGEIESVKAVADLNCPISGTVSEININVEEHLEVLSRDPWNAGWLIKVKPDTRTLDGENLMDAAAYEAFIAASKH